MEAQGYAPLTVRAYTRSATYWLIVLGETHVLDASRNSALAFLRWCQAQGWSASSIRNHVSGIRRWYNWLAGEGLGRVVDPWLGLRLPKIQPKVRTYLTEEQVAKVLALRPEDLRGVRDVAMFAFAYATGCRAVSIRLANIGDVNIDAGMVVITGKGGKQSVHALWVPAARALERYLRITRRSWALPDEQALFVGRHGRRIGSTAISSAMDRLARQAGVPHFTVHTIRRSVATHVRDAGAPPEVPRDLLDHEDVKTTEKHYLAANDTLRFRLLAMYHPMATGALGDVAAAGEI